MAGASLGISVEIDDREVLQAIQRLQDAGGNLQGAFADIGEYLLISHRERWDRQVSPEGEPWAPLAPQTIKRKKKNRDKVLVLEGDLRDLLRYQDSPDSLEFGTDRIYGASHQFGREEAGIPARPFLGISDEDRVGILDILRDHLEEALGGKPTDRLRRRLSR